MLEEGARSRKIGKEMNIFTFDEDVGLPLWLPNGAAIEELERLAKKERALSWLSARADSAHRQRIHVPHQRSPALLPGQACSLRWTWTERSTT